MLRTEQGSHKGATWESQGSHIVCQLTTKHELDWLSKLFHDAHSKICMSHPDCEPARQLQVHASSVWLTVTGSLGTPSAVVSWTASAIKASAALLPDFRAPSRVAWSRWSPHTYRRPPSWTGRIKSVGGSCMTESHALLVCQKTLHCRVLPQSYSELLIL